ncbi:MAG: endolytic transglycosylase MltG, partial [Candidatus Sericytochromatia bacterium]|nr:endolytic transglycosylase MltG [Candidatus Sericytochromatia bacterium]
MKFFRRLLILLVFSALIATIPAYFYFKQGLNAINPDDQATKLFYVNSGSSLNLILKKLETEGLIKDYRIARAYTFIKGNKKQLQPGYYKLSKSMSYEDIFNKISSGKIFQVWLTIPEGFSMRKISKRIEKKDLSSNKYLAITSKLDSSFKEEFPFLTKLDTNNSLEGYLFPDTYDITGGKEIDLVYLQLKRFENTIYEAWQNKPADWKMSLNQTLTLA